MQKVKIIDHHLLRQNSCLVLESLCVSARDSVHNEMKEQREKLPFRSFLTAKNFVFHKF